MLVKTSFFFFFQVLPRLIVYLCVFMPTLLLLLLKYAYLWFIYNDDQQSLLFGKVSIAVKEGKISHREWKILCHFQLPSIFIVCLFFKCCSCFLYSNFKKTYAIKKNLKNKTLFWKLNNSWSCLEFLDVATH